MVDMWDSIGRTLLALGAVLLLMGAVAWVARQVLAQRAGGAMGTPFIEIVASSYLAPRKSVALVAIAGEYFVVGLTADQLIPLGRIEDRTNVAALLKTSGHTVSQTGVPPQAMSPADWWRQITTALGQGKKGDPHA